MLGLAWIFSSVSVFIQDTVQVVQVITRLGFWFTPIFWKIDLVPRKLQFWLEINPVYYLIKGYRNSLIYGIGFWETPGWTIAYWSITAVVFVAGAVIFQRLRPHFADVL